MNALFDQNKLYSLNQQAKVNLTLSTQGKGILGVEV